MERHMPEALLDPRDLPRGRARSRCCCSPASCSAPPPVRHTSAPRTPRAASSTTWRRAQRNLRTGLVRPGGGRHAGAVPLDATLAAAGMAAVAGLAARACSPSSGWPAGLRVPRPRRAAAWPVDRRGAQRRAGGADRRRAGAARRAAARGPAQRAGRRLRRPRRTGLRALRSRRRAAGAARRRGGARHRRRRRGGRAGVGAVRRARGGGGDGLAGRVAVAPQLLALGRDADHVAAVREPDRARSGARLALARLALLALASCSPGSAPALASTRTRRSGCGSSWPRWRACRSRCAHRRALREHARGARRGRCWSRSWSRRRCCSTPRPARRSSASARGRPSSSAAPTGASSSPSRCRARCSPSSSWATTIRATTCRSRRC